MCVGTTPQPSVLGWRPPDLRHTKTRRLYSVGVTRTQDVDVLAQKVDPLWSRVPKFSSVRPFRDRVLGTIRRWPEEFARGNNRETAVVTEGEVTSSGPGRPLKNRLKKGSSITRPRLDTNKPRKTSWEIGIRYRHLHKPSQHAKSRRRKNSTFTNFKTTEKSRVPLGG